MIGDESGASLVEAKSGRLSGASVNSLAKMQKVKKTDHCGLYRFDSFTSGKMSACYYNI